MNFRAQASRFVVPASAGLRLCGRLKAELQTKLVRGRAGCALIALSAIAPLSQLHAQTTVSGTFAVAGGAALVEGDRAAFQHRFRQRKHGCGGVEEFSVTRATDDSQFRFEARFLPGNEDYRLAARWERFDAIYIDASFHSFRTFYDGSGGRFLPRNMAISWFDETLELDRSFFSFEIGTLVPDAPQWRLRYDRSTRDGAKNSIRWGDSNLPGQPFVPRAFIPSYLLADEVRDTVTLEVGARTEMQAWRVAGRYERTRLNNRVVARRRVLEPQDRFVTSRDTVDTDLFSGHAYYERTHNEKLRWSAGGVTTKIDTNLSGSKIYGSTPDAAYSPTFARRQAQDVGYHSLLGDAQLRQYIGNLNVVYQPTKQWILRPGLKYEHLRQESGEGHVDTDVGGGAAAPALQRQIESASRNSWNEFTEEFEARYLRFANWNLNARAQWNQGTGNLIEQSILLPNRTTVLDRDSEYERVGQRYILNATWTLKPGLTLGAQYNYRLKLADYDHRRDSTGNRSFDRYPAYIVDQDIESQDGNVRLSWRPRSMLSLVTRYAYQRATITSTMDGAGEIQSGELERQIVTQTVTWTPLPRLSLNAAFNLTRDELRVPPHRLTVLSSNDYTHATLGAGYAVGKITDLYVDLSHYRADNYIDNPTVTLPLNAGQKLQSAFLTWVRRQNARLIYTAKYGYATNRDGTFGGLNDFDAHIVYGKVQYKF